LPGATFEWNNFKLESSMAYQDILYGEQEGVATITINRPDVHNAFRVQTCEELIAALLHAGWNKSIGVIVLTGAGDKAFCSGGDQRSQPGGGGYGGRGTAGLPIEELQSTIRDVPQPVVARVQGYAIGGGNVLATLCDLTIASERAIFAQVGPKVGSVDPGFGTAYLARIVGEKRAREMWYLCRHYTAQEALAMGLVNVVVPHEQLDADVARWCAELLERSPTALTIAKRSFNADTEQIRGNGAMGFQALALYFQSAEHREGVAAFREKRPPEFRKFVQ
jgi:2-ketocyclohexanecarboxyl-CoA hydrolase